MVITHNDASATKTKSFMRLFLLVSLAYFPFINLGASELKVDEFTQSETSAEQYTSSQGQFRKTLNDQQRKNIIKAHKLNTLPDQLNGKATSKTRVSMLSSQKEVSQSAKNSIFSSQSNNNHNDYEADFAIYGASSFLQDDYDGDGYYQTFSVVFDADIYSYSSNQLGEVYALLYLSKNGGPWTHYFTTDDFIIESDTDADEYEVITTFLSGYSSNEYDILIDLYQVGYSDVVASYSSDDSNALYALPLESADYDQVYVEPYIEVVEVHGGSMSVLILLLLSIVLIRSHKFT